MSSAERDQILGRLGVPSEITHLRKRVIILSQPTEDVTETGGVFVCYNQTHE